MGLLGGLDELVCIMNWCLVNVHYMFITIKYPMILIFLVHLVASIVSTSHFVFQGLFTFL